MYVQPLGMGAYNAYAPQIESLYVFFVKLIIIVRTLREKRGFPGCFVVNVAHSLESYIPVQ